MLERRGAHSATVLADGYVFLFGGRGATGAVLSSAEVFTPGGKFLAVDSPNLEPRAGHAAVRLDSDAVLIVGGPAEPAGPAQVLGFAKQVVADHVLGSRVGPVVRIDLLQGG